MLWTKKNWEKVKKSQFFKVTRMAQIFDPTYILKGASTQD